MTALILSDLLYMTGGGHDHGVPVPEEPPAPPEDGPHRLWDDAGADGGWRWF